MSRPTHSVIILLEDSSIFKIESGKSWIYTFTSSYIYRDTGHWQAMGTVRSLHSTIYSTKLQIPLNQDLIPRVKIILAWDWSIGLTTILNKHVSVYCCGLSLSPCRFPHGRVGLRDHLTRLLRFLFLFCYYSFMFSFYSPVWTSCLTSSFTTLRWTLMFLPILRCSLPNSSYLHCSYCIILSLFFQHCLYFQPCLLVSPRGRTCHHTKDRRGHKTTTRHPGERNKVDPGYKSIQRITW